MRQTQTSFQQRQSGFSLLEVLVAFSILALSLGVLMQTFSSAIRNARVSAAYSQAADLAESVLARVGIDLPLDQGGQSDTEQGFRWTLEIAPYTIADLAAPAQGIAAYQVTAQVSWSDPTGTHSLALHTLRLAQLPQ